MSILSVSSIVILDDEGKWVVVKYYEILKYVIFFFIILFRWMFIFVGVYEMYSLCLSEICLLSCFI